MWPFAEFPSVPFQSQFHEPAKALVNRLTPYKMSKRIFAKMVVRHYIISAKFIQPFHMVTI